LEEVQKNCGAGGAFALVAPFFSNPSQKDYTLSFQRKDEEEARWRDIGRKERVWNGFAVT